MKTRIVWTKIWEDDWFDSLNQESRLVFLYLLTCPQINLSGCFELKDKTICFYSHLTPNQLEKAKKELYPKVKFYQNYVYIPNASTYNGYIGSKNEVAKLQELEKISESVKNALIKGNDDRVSIPYAYPTDTSINHKSEIINHKSEIKENSKDYIPESKKLLVIFNSIKGTKYTSYESISKNLSYWLTKHSFEDIEQAIKNSNYHKFWKEALTPEKLLRRTGANGEACDRIDELLNFSFEKKLKDLEPKHVEDLRLHPERLYVYQNLGYDTSRIGGLCK